MALNSGSENLEVMREAEKYMTYVGNLVAANIPKSGEIIELLDQVFITFFSPLVFISRIRFSSFISMNGPFLSDLGIVSLLVVVNRYSYLAFLPRTINFCEAFFLFLVFRPFAS